MRTFILALIACLRAALVSRAALALENAALCRELAPRSATRATEKRVDRRRSAQLSGQVR